MKTTRTSLTGRFIGVAVLTMALGFGKPSTAFVGDVPSLVSDVPEAVDGAAIIAGAVSSFFFPIFGQCLEVSIAIHVGGAHIVKGLSGTHVSLNCEIPITPDESFAFCPAWPSDVPAGVATILDNATLVEVDLIELTRNCQQVTHDYLHALEVQNVACANILYPHLVNVYAEINLLADDLADQYTNAAQLMRASSTDFPQPIINLTNFMDQLRTLGFPPEDIQAMSEINATLEEGQEFLDILNRLSNQDILAITGLDGATEIRFSDGIEAAADVYRLYNPPVRLPAPPTSVPTMGELGMIIMTLLLLSGGMIFISRRRFWGARPMNAA